MLVPKLRFKRDDETSYPEWNKTKIGNITKTFSASRVHREEWQTEGVPFWRSSDVMAYHQHKENSMGKAFITPELYETLSSKSGKMQKDDILITGGGSIGVPYLIPNDDPLYVKDADLLCIQKSANHYSKFLYQFFWSSSFRNYLGVISHKGTIAHYTITQINDTPISIPCLEEQQKIADFLSIVDEVISQSEAEVRNLEQQKKGAMQKIFSQEVRFKREDGTAFPQWEEKEFGTTVMIERGGSPRPIKQYITNDEGYNWVKIGDAPEYGRYITHTSEKIKKSGLNKTRQVFKGDLILSNSMSFGKPYIMAVDGCIHDGWLLIRNNQNIYNLIYLCYLLGTEYMLKQYKSLAGGSTVNNLNKDLVSMTTVFVPCLEEQQKIADFLSAYDEAITYAKQELDKWKELKKGLLQQMFV